MVDRRDIIGGGLVAGLAAAFGDPAAAQQRRTDASDDTATLRVADAIDSLRQSIERGHESSEVAKIRAQQHAFLKTNQKFPDYVDVGIDIWDRLHDWHVRTRQPLTIVRTTDGHYGMVLAVTTVILQPEQVGSYISWGYDTK